MSRNVRTILGIAALLLAVAVATVVLPTIFAPAEETNGAEAAGPSFPVQNEPIPIELGGYLLGEELEKIPQLNDLLAGRTLDPLLLAGVLTFLLVGAIVTGGVVLYFLMRRLDRMAVETKSNEAFQTALSRLEQREKEENKRLAEVQPPTEIPPHTRPRTDAINTGLAIIIFVALGAVAISETVRPGATGEWLGVHVPVWVPFMLGAVLITAVVLALTLRSTYFEGVEQGDVRPVNWSAIWVTVSGLVFLGLGTGLMVALRAAGGG